LYRLGPQLRYEVLVTADPQKLEGLHKPVTRDEIRGTCSRSALGAAPLSNLVSSFSQGHQLQIGLAVPVENVA
jgi:hypothetical protein